MDLNLAITVFFISLYAVYGIANNNIHFKKTVVGSRDNMHYKICPI